jgi:hypothetical protein
VNKLVCAFVLCAATALSQSFDETVKAMNSGGLMNGRYWQAISIDKQQIFISGALDGVAEFRALLDTPEANSEQKQLHQQAAEKFSASGFLVPELAKEITKLYDDPANVKIPIVIMEVTACWVLKGDSQDHTDARLRILRTAFNR